MATHWLILSPHLDDAVYSCGGLMWQWAQAGDSVQVLTICAGMPDSKEISDFAQSLHDRWGVAEAAVQHRQDEDIAALQRLGATWTHLDIPDCICRTQIETGRALYASEAPIFGKIDPLETALVEALAAELADRLRKPVELLIPMGLGGHVDHRLTRAAAQALIDQHGFDQPLWNYLDFPYVLQTLGASEQVRSLANLRADGTWHHFDLDPEAIQAWGEAISMYESQSSTFWRSPAELMAAVQGYARRLAGAALFQNIAAV